MPADSGVSEFDRATAPLEQFDPEVALQFLELMAINYAKILNRRVTPQSQPIPGSTQVANSAGGYSWEVDDWTRFDRFLIFGAEGGTYYTCSTSRNT